MPRNEYHCQAIDENNSLTFDNVVNTRKAQSQQMQDVLRFCLEGNAVFMRRQTIGARGWAVFKLVDNTLSQVFKEEAEIINNRFPIEEI